PRQARPLSLHDALPICGAPLPSPWSQADVGGVGLPGSASYSSPTFTVQGSGGDIWGAADGFHYVYQPINGDAQIVARVTSEQNPDRKSTRLNSSHVTIS